MRCFWLLLALVVGLVLRGAAAPPGDTISRVAILVEGGGGPEDAAKQEAQEMKGIDLHLLILGVLAAAVVARPSQRGAMAKEGADIVRRQDRGMAKEDARQLPDMEDTVLRELEVICLCLSLFLPPLTTVADVEDVFVNKEKVQKEIKAAVSENASIICEVAQTKTEVKWFKEGKQITSSKKFKVEAEGKTRRLIVQQVEKEDAGEYTCEAAGQKLTFKVIAEAAKVAEVEDVFINKEKVQKEIKAAASENASITCEVAQAKTEVKWFKDGKRITSSKKFKVEAEGKTRRLIVQQVEKEDAGEYTCEAGNQKLAFKLNVPEVADIFAKKEKVQKEVKAVLKESTALVCEVATSDTQVKWYKDGKPLSTSKKIKVVSDGTSRKLVLEQVEKNDAGNYTCEASGQKLIFKIEAVEPEAKFERKVPQEKPIVVQEEKSISLSTSVVPEDAEVKWLKDGIEIKASKKYEVKKDGASRTLTVKVADVKDTGVYTCETKSDKQQFQVQVQEVPVKFAKKLEPVKAEIGGALTLSCELSQTGGKVVWRKDGVELKANKRYQMREVGEKRILVITGLRARRQGELLL
nr:obscurin-like [Zootoca vivipara]